MIEDRRAWATFDSSKAYRYTLGRLWDVNKPRCVFIMLNPSIADAHVLDPTVRRCIGFAKAWGYGSLEIGNLFALRSTNPKALYKHPDPVGPENDAALLALQKRAARLIVAWGTHGALKNRGVEVARALEPHGELWALGTTRDGHPLHPLYLLGAVDPQRFTVPAA